jgi:hypothetical protein
MLWKRCCLNNASDLDRTFVFDELANNEKQVGRELQLRISTRLDVV